MQLETLELTNFRNHTKRTVSLEPTTTIIGPNAAGKTNILEAIRFISIMRSFRAKKERDAITFGEDVARIVATGTVGGSKLVIAVGLSGDRKQVTVNKVKKPISQAVGLFKTVLFAPDDFDFISGQPTLRRRFLDTILCQADRGYVSLLLDLARVVKHRNAVLHMLAEGYEDKETLAIWDEKLLELAKKIQPKRADLIQTLNQKLSNLYQSLSGENDSLSLVYEPSDIESIDRKTWLARDMRVGSTTMGPHHDDLTVLLGDRSLHSFGSRGERRSATLAIKQAEVAVLTAEEPPILLLDDIFSELDPKRQERLSQLFGEHQTIITTTHLTRDLKAKSHGIIDLS